MVRPYKNNTYQRLYRRQVQALRLAYRDKPKRTQVRMAFEAYGALTMKQLLSILGKHYHRATVAYHVRCLVQQGVLRVTRDNGRTGDGSWYRYTLVRSEAT